MYTETERLQKVEKYKEDLVTLSNEKDEIIRRVLVNNLVDKYSTSLGFTRRDIERDIATALAIQSDLDTKTSYSLQEILDSYNEEANWLIPRLLYSTGLYLIAATPKGYKSTFCYEICHSLVISQSFLGSPTRKGRVCFFQCEEPKATIARRLTSRGFTDDDELLQDAIDNDMFRVERKFNLKTDVTWLSEYIDEHSPNLLIFDSLRAITSTIEVSENSAEFSKYLYALQRLLVLKEVCGIVIHHANKGQNQTNSKNILNLVAGSLAITGATDGVIILQPEKTNPGEPDKVRLSTVPRNTVPIEMSLSVNKGSGGRWRFELEEEIGVDDELRIVEQKILRHLSSESRPGEYYSKREICNDLDLPYKDINVENALSRLVESLILECRLDKTTKPKQFVYKLPVNSPWTSIQKEPSNSFFEDEDPLIEGLLSLDSSPKFADLTFLSAESKLASALAECGSREQIDTLTKEWSNELKGKVWELMSKSEKEKITFLKSPPKFEIGLSLEIEEEIRSIASVVRSEEVDSWVYTLDDGSIFNEQDLEHEIESINELDRLTDSLVS